MIIGMLGDFDRRPGTIFFAPLLKFQSEEGILLGIHDQSGRRASHRSTVSWKSMQSEKRRKKKMLLLHYVARIFAMDFDYFLLKLKSEPS